MTPDTSELAYRTAITAGPFAASLAGDFLSIAGTLRGGDLEPALETFEATADRLQRFLTFLMVTSELLAVGRTPVGAVLADYSRRILELVGRVESALDSGDLVALTLTLEHGLARALADYAEYDFQVSKALAPIAAVA